MHTLTRGYCRGEQRETTFRFAGWATESASENHVRPRAFYQACTSGCGTMLLTLGAPTQGHVLDAEGMCRAVLDENLRRHGMDARVTAADRPVQSGNVGIDVENVLGDLLEYMWHLYNEWNPRSGVEFAGYALWRLRQKVKRFVARSAGIPAGTRVAPKAHARTVCGSWDQLVEDTDGQGQLGWALASLAGNPVEDRVADRPGWMDGRGGRGPVAYGRG